MNTQGHSVLRTAPTESRSALDQDVQKVGRELFCHQLVRIPLETSAETNTLINLAGYIFATQSFLHGYVIPEPSLLVSEARAVPVSWNNERFDDEFRFLANRGTPDAVGVQSESQSILNDDCWEDGVIVDWDRARKLYLRMIAK